MIYSLTGIDRIDNKKGYIVGNVNPACTICNYMKYIYDYDIFLEYCQNIYENVGSTTHNLLPHRSYDLYKRDAQKNHRKFLITETEFENILQNDCYYCDGKNGWNCGSELIRMNSNCGYCLKTNTLVAACTICNTMKKNYSYNIFYNQILKILLHHDKIKKSEYKEKYAVSQFSELDELIAEIEKAAVDNNDTTSTADRRTTHEYIHDDKYYINNIWNSYNISALKPELEFCETKEQTDIWTFYRNITSSYDRTNNGGTKILVRNAHSKKYLGLADLFASNNNGIKLREIQRSY